MVVGAMCGKGVIPFIKVPPKVKVNSKMYIEQILKPILEVHIPRIYGDEVNKVIVHHEQASSHTSKKTQAYATDLKRRLGITIIPNAHIPVKSPDVSAMDFYGFGSLK
jgi:hypothetical protein